MSNQIRKLHSSEIHQVSGADTTLVNLEDGLHVYMTRKNEKFEFGSLGLRSDGTFYGEDKSSYHFEILEKMWGENGIFHARIWK